MALTSFGDLQYIALPAPSGEWKFVALNANLKPRVAP